jgi:hypothetical protein
MVDIDDIRKIARDLPRAYEVVVRDRIKFRVGRIVFLAMSRDETLVGFGFPKDERAALIDADPARYLLPLASDLRYNWICARMAGLDADLLREHVLEAWAMCVPKSVSAGYLDGPA